MPYDIGAAAATALRAACLSSMDDHVGEPLRDAYAANVGVKTGALKASIRYDRPADAATGTVIGGGHGVDYAEFHEEGVSVYRDNATGKFVSYDEAGRLIRMGHGATLEHFTANHGLRDAIIEVTGQ